MGNLIKKALDSIGMTNFFIKKDDKYEGEYIVYNYISTPGYYADNEKKGDRYTILLNAHLNTSIEKKKEKIIKAMNEYGFKGGRVEATLIDKNGYYDTAITFNGYKS